MGLSANASATITLTISAIVLVVNQFRSSRAGKTGKGRGACAAIGMLLRNYLACGREAPQTYRYPPVLLYCPSFLS